jgi:hypothetical protein
LRALACAALSFMAGAAFAAQYTAIELPAKPAAKHGAYNHVIGSVLAADGRAVIHASTFFKDDTSVGVAELCSAAGDVCKKREPIDKNVSYGAASSDFKRLAGNLYDAAGHFSAVRQQKGVLEVLAEHASALGINRKGVTVGVKGDDAFLYDTELHVLPRLTDGYAVAHAINDNGVTVGESRLSLHENRAVRWDQGQVSLVQTNIPHGLGFGSVATVITPAGTIYGSSSFHDRGTTQHAVRFSADGTAVSLGALNANQGNTSDVLAANTQGASVGWSTNYPSDGTQQAVLFKEGQVLELATAVPQEVRAKYAFQFATAINDAGQILVAALRRPTYEAVVLRLDPQP